MLKRGSKDGVAVCLSVGRAMGLGALLVLTAHSKAVRVRQHASKSNSPELFERSRRRLRSEFSGGTAL